MGPIWAESGHNAQIGPMWVPYRNFSPYGTHIGPLQVILVLHTYDFVLVTEKMSIKGSFCFSYKPFLFTRMFKWLFMDFYTQSLSNGPHMGPSKKLLETEGGGKCRWVSFIVFIIIFLFILRLFIHFREFVLFLMSGHKICKNIVEKYVHAWTWSETVFWEGKLNSQIYWKRTVFF